MAPRPGHADARPAPRSLAAIAAAMQRQLHEVDALLLELPSQRCCACAWFTVQVCFIPGKSCHLPVLECRDHQLAWHHAGLCSMVLQSGMVCCRREGATATLLWLDAEVRGVAARLQLLDAVGVVAAAAAATAATDTAGGGCAAASAQLIDGLQALLGPRLLQGGPQGDQSRRFTVIRP